MFKGSNWEGNRKEEQKQDQGGLKNDGPARPVRVLNDGPRPGGPFTTPKEKPEIFTADEQEIINKIKPINQVTCLNDVKIKDIMFCESDISTGMGMESKMGARRSSRDISSLSFAWIDGNHQCGGLLKKGRLTLWMKEGLLALGAEVIDKMESVSFVMIGMSRSICISCYSYATLTAKDVVVAAMDMRDTTNGSENVLMAIDGSCDKTVQLKPNKKAAYEIFAGRLEVLEVIIDARNADTYLKAGTESGSLHSNF
ncbi:hypothetical protein Tco_1172906 [Tanacetum coccineum]